LRVSLFLFFMDFSGDVRDMKKKKTVGKKRTKAKAKAKVKAKVKSGKKALLDTENLIRSLMVKEQEVLQTEDALVESMRRFRDLFEQSPIGVAIYDPAGELLIVNNSYLEIFGLASFGDIKMQNLFKALRLPGKREKELRSGEVIQREIEFNFEKAGLATSRKGAAHMLFTVSPLFREKKVIGYMLQIQDVTERKKITEAQRLAQLGRLLSDMAHEVNNPLMIISGRAEFALIEGVEDEKIRDTLNIILEQCYLAKEIIQRLLKYSRIGKVKKEPVDMHKALGLIVDILQHHFRMSSIELEKDIHPSLPRVIGNEKQLQEVFMNIIRNSADAMPDGGVIKVTARREKNFIKIDIEDTGEGMSEQILERIFEPFFTTKQKGTGLGLAVCHTIIQEHGGQLLYDSEVAKGTKASILLPI